MCPCSSYAQQLLAIAFAQYSFITMITPDKGCIELMLPIAMVFMCHEKYFCLQLDAKLHALEKNNYAS